MKWHRHKLPRSATPGDTWSCPREDCRRNYRYVVEHVEELVAIDTASMVDIGRDEELWVRCA